MILSERAKETEKMQEENKANKLTVMLEDVAPSSAVPQGYPYRCNCTLQF